MRRAIDLLCWATTPVYLFNGLCVWLSFRDKDPSYCGVDIAGLVILEVVLIPTAIASFILDLNVLRSDGSGAVQSSKITFARWSRLVGTAAGSLLFFVAWLLG
jgi:hypothetical protein